MAELKNLKTRIVLTHDEYNNLVSKTLKNGEVVLAKVGETQAPGEVAQPIWMMKIGDGTSTVGACPWLVAPAADVYEWAKKAELDVADVPPLPISKIEGLQDALDALAAEDERLAGLITGLTNTKADKVSGATAGNFAGLDANGNLTDSRKKAADFAEADHNHKASELTDFSNDVKAVVNTMGLGTNDTIQALNERMGTAETDIDNLENNKVNKEAYNTKVAALEKADTDLDTAVKAAQADATSAKEAIEAFLDENAATDGVVNTLKEIQAELDAGDASAASLLAEVNKIKDGTTVVPKATEADTVDGKHADDFATADHNHDDVYSKLSHTHVVADITDYATDVAAKIKIETDARAEAVEDLQGQIDDVKATADTALQSITTTENGGLKITGTNQIDIDDTIVFVLDGGTAADLD